MCVVSAVMDRYQPWVPGPNQWPHYPTQPYKAPYQYPHPVTPVASPPTIIIQEKTFTPEDLRKLIEAFKAELHGAEIFDALTGQPDCVDPEKEKLIERVAELEARLDAIAEAVQGDSEEE